MTPARLFDMIKLEGSLILFWNPTQVIFAENVLGQCLPEAPRIL